MKPLIIYLDDDDRVAKLYSEYIIEDGLITFYSSDNKIIIPLSRLLKIKYDLKEDE